LLVKGHTVLDVMRPNRQLRYLHGKSDSLDAESAAKCEGFEHTRGALIEDRPPIPASLMPEGAGNPTLPRPVGPVISRFSCRAIQPPSARCAMTLRSSPRGMRRSRFSTLAVNFHAKVSRFFHRELSHL